MLTSVIGNINSREELEKALIEIIRAIKVNTPQVKLSVAKLGTELRKATGQTPNSIVKKLNLGASFTKFLHSCPTFQLKKNRQGIRSGDRHRASIALVKQYYGKRYKEM
jgi:hypothetical protein